ncbi:MAG: CDGSH iron-sulfur domain-containing protein [Haloarculaceae archaeon]
MSREITHDAHGPRIVDEEEFEERGNIAICQCGLSADYPFCDGSHQNTTDEEEGVRYKYEGDDDENPRHVIEEIVFSSE